jgi:hypothetical protein
MNTSIDSIPFAIPRPRLEFFSILAQTSEAFMKKFLPTGQRNEAHDAIRRIRRRLAGLPSGGSSG